MLHAAGNKTDFLLAFPRRRRFDEFPGIDAAGRELPGVAIDRRPILTHHGDAAVGVDRDEHYRGRVPHDLCLVFAAVGMTARVDFDGEDTAFENGWHDSFSLS